jgi:hypothetical protein
MNSSVQWNLVGDPVIGGAHVVMRVNACDEPPCLANEILPLQNVSLETMVDGKEVVLRWSVKDTQGIIGFEIQRQGKDGSFKPLEIIEGGVTTLERETRTYSLKEPGFGRHTFRVKQINQNGGTAYSNKVDVLVEVPDLVVTEGAHPNPFSTSTTLGFGVSNEQNVRVKLYNVQGRLIKNLADVRAVPHERLKIVIDGSGLSSGIYLVRLEGDLYSAMERVTLLR